MLTSYELSTLTWHACMQRNLAKNVMEKDINSASLRTVKKTILTVPALKKTLKNMDSHNPPNPLGVYNTMHGNNFDILALP